MIPGQFDYVRPGDLTETLRILTDREGEAKLLAGGYSLLPLIKLRLAQPALLVDLRDVDGLDGIEETDDQLIVGARATHRRIHEHPVVVDHYPLYHDVAGGIGDPQVRNWGTIGGSVAHADPASDWPAALIAAGADVVCLGPGGERVVPAREFFIDTFTTAIEPTEILTAVRFGRRTRGAGGAYVKLERRVGDFATVGVATVVLLEDGAIAAAGVGVTGVSPSPFAAIAAEEALVGSAPDEAAFKRAGDAAAAMSQPAADIRGPVAYKRAMVAEVTARSLRTAVERARAYA
jgi:carbon-monoxide dehydrogenase medium subunit